MVTLKYLDQREEEIKIDRYTLELYTRGIILGEIASLEYTLRLVSCETPSPQELVLAQNRTVLKEGELEITDHSESAIVRTRMRLIDNIQQNSGQYLEALMK